MLGQPLDRGCVEQIRVVGQRDPQLTAGLLELDRHVEAGRRHRQRHLLDLDAGQPGRLLWRVLQHDHDLEQRGAAGVAVGLDGVHHPFERQVLAGEGVLDGARTTSRNSVNERSPSTLERSTRVFTKNPTRPASSARSRPEATVPTAMSSWPDRRPNRTWQAATNAMKSVLFRGPGQFHEPGR